METHQRQAFIAKTSIFCCTTNKQALPYLVMVVSPCKKHPETGQPCEYLHVNKNNTMCEACEYVGGTRPKTDKFMFTTKEEISSAKVLDKECFVCKEKAVGIFQEKYLCHRCREMVRKRISRHLPKEKWFIPAKQR